MIRVIDSHPPLSYSALEQIEDALGLALPGHYRDFLLRHNGGFIEEGPRAFDAPITQIRGDQQLDTVDDSIVELFGFGEPDETARRPASLTELHSQYVSEDFLPTDVFVVGRCESSSLICLSTRRETHGQVLYWYYYWQYPWATSHFDARLARAQAQYPDAARILASPEEPGYQEVVDAFNYATLTPLAANFQRFIADLRPEASA